MDCIGRDTVSGKLCTIMEMAIDNKYGVTVRQISDEIGVGPRQCWRYLASLEASGFIEKLNPDASLTCTPQKWGRGERFRKMKEMASP